LPAAVNAVLLPRLSEANVDRVALQGLVRRAMSITLVLTLPLAAVLLTLRHPFIRALFGEKTLSEGALNNIAFYFAIALVGTPAAALSSTLACVSASLRDMRAPSTASAVAAVLTIVAVPLVGTRSGSIGVIVVLALMNWVTCMWLTAYLRIVHGLRAWTRMSGTAWRVFPIAVVGGISAYLIHSYLREALAQTELGNLIDLAASGGLAALAAYAAGLWLGLEEIQQASAFMRWQAGRIFAIPERG
jgi:peptidoglycan biosynthesis protein MviN/MurJ (putative lipid II flippase)